MKNLILLLITAFSVFATNNTLLADGKPRPNRPDFWYPVTLYQQKDYYRSITEILRLKFLYPEDSAISELDLYLAKSYYQMGIYSKAEDIAHQLLSDPGIISSKDDQKKIGALLTFSLLHQDKIPPAGHIWREHVTPDDSNQPPTMDNIPDWVNPERAKLFSSIIPGSGLLLSHQYGSGIVSFLLNAVFIAGSYQFFINEQYGISGLMLFFEISWYTGGKKAAYEAAVTYNNRQYNELRQKWIDSQNLTF